MAGHAPVLMNCQGMRERLGGCGRDRVICNYRWSAVMPAFGRLWSMQLSEARRCEAGARRKHLRYRELFSHYPSHVADPKKILYCDPRDLDAVRRQFGSGSLHAKIAAQCAAQPTTLLDLTQHSPSAVIHSVYALLKNGALRLSEPVPTEWNACRTE